MKAIRTYNRNKIIYQLENEFSDFIEDQREKEGRLFYRWHKSLYRAKEVYENMYAGDSMYTGRLHSFFNYNLKIIYFLFIFL